MFFPTPYRDECFIGHSILCMITVLNWLSHITNLIICVCTHICRYACISSSYPDILECPV